MEQLLEELTLNAWPAIRVMHYDGWVIRFSGGYTRRANSVNLLAPSTISLREKVAYCEEVYRQAGLSTVFKICPTPDSEELDRILADLGYELQGAADVMTCPLQPAPEEHPIDFRIDSELTDWWFGAAERLNGVNVHLHRHLEQILHNIEPKHAFASIRDGAVPIAIALAVVERNWMGLYDIVTAVPFRRKGFGRHLVLSLMDWARDDGVENAYLQVMSDNMPAVALYGSMGFETRYRYWYRVKD
ncbi:MAG: GNAT family N-acetyltransferase [Fimbriimonas sp.]|nr:GNAT family N-acetyltransferase [Fimbriimonas sp.]